MLLLNVIDPDKPNYIEPKEIVDILTELGLTEAEYYEALSISTCKDFQVHFKRLPNSCFVNNYFSARTYLSCLQRNNLYVEKLNLW